MTAGELLARFRSDLADEAEPFLWSDDDIFAYIDDAQKTYCRKTDGIPDARTPAVVQLAVVPNDGWVDLHPSILKIRGCTRADSGRDVEILNREDMSARGLRFDGRLGPVTKLVIGEERNAARVFPTSNETIGLELLVFRLPLLDITDDQPLEIESEHHEGLLLWCKHRGYSKADADTYDRNKAGEFEQRFEAYCANAKAEARRKQFKPRVVAYGGI